MPPPDPAITVVVGPVSMEVTISKSTQIHSFETAPSREVEPVIRHQLVEEIELKGQQVLTEALTKQPGFRVLPFQDARRLQADLALPHETVTDESLRALADQASAEVAIGGRFIAYGAVPWKYWVTGLATETLAELLAVGLASGWNPAAIGGYFAFDVLLVDFPIWGGGAYILGWAFRPVIVEIRAVQSGFCPGPVWQKQEEAITIPRTTLAAYPPDQRARKEIQLQVNLNRAMEDLAETAAQKLRVQPCTKDGHPKRIRNWWFLPF
jgi:hypothetical protein